MLLNLQHKWRQLEEYETESPNHQLCILSSAVLRLIFLFAINRAIKIINRDYR